MNAEDPAVNSSDASVAPNDNRLTPLPGEHGIPNVAQRPTIPISRKGLAAIALLVISLAAVSAMSLQRLVASGKKADDGLSKRAGDRPAAASLDPKKLDMSAAPAAGAASTANSVVRVPALVPTADELADPIGVRRTGQETSPTASKRAPPEDAPAVLLMSAGSSRRTIDQPPVPESSSGDPLGQTRRNLGAYERQLQRLLDTLSSSTSVAKSGIQPRANIPTNSPGLTPSGGSSQAMTHRGGDLFGGQLQGSATPTVSASLLAKRSLVLPKGTAFTCALKTEVVSAASGFTSCQVQRNVYSDDGRVLLIERGSHMDGEYRITSLRPGTVRIPVLWVRIRTPNGVVVNIDSPGTGALGAPGIDGYVDNRWGERIGAAMLLSLIDDSVKLAIQHESSAQSGGTVVLQSTTGNTSKLAEKVLDSTINIPPLIYQNQGGIVGIYVARDVDFSSVYELRPISR